jgi:hypothetical protein
VAADQLAEGNYMGDEFTGDQGGKIGAAAQPCYFTADPQACLASTCAPTLDAAHTHWLQLMNQWDTDLRAYAKAEGAYTAPLITNLANPLAHQIAVDRVKVMDDTYLFSITAAAYSWLSLESQYVLLGCTDQSSTGFVPPGIKAADPADPGRCSAVPADTKFVVEIPALASVKVNCESVEVAVEDEELVGPFGTVEVKKDLETTVFVGVKAGTTAPGFGAELQEGFYVKTTPEGVKDYGVRIAPSVSAGTTALIEYGSGVDVSLVGTISYIPTAFGFK